jgi:thioredoxin reductase (NADPH)
MEEPATEIDVLIIGGGPAGMSAALWCADLGLGSVVLEQRAEPGGQLLHTFGPVKNYLGIEAANGRDLRDRFLKHLENRRVAVATGAAVERADLASRTVLLHDGRRFSANSIVIATGVRRRKLGVPGEDEFFGRGILESGVGDRHKVEGKDVVIVGGGDAAIENAAILSESATKVIVVHRRAELRAREELIERALSSGRVEFVTGAEVARVAGDEVVKGVEVRDLLTGKTTVIAADAVLIRIGVVPNTELFRRQIELDSAGYVIAAADGTTSVTGIYAVGDVANPVSPTITTATGTAATAVKSIAQRATRPNRASP